MTGLAEACADLERWLPEALALLAEPDADGTTSGGKPGSAPPWNQAAAAAAMDAHEGLRRLEASLRLAVTGGPGRRRGGSDAATRAAIDAIGNLGQAVTADAAAQAARILCRWSSAIMMLPAIDEAERFIRLPDIACPYCGPRGFTGSLRASPRTGKVACIRYGACADADGNTPTGLMGRSQLDGTPCVSWSDGLVT